MTAKKRPAIIVSKGDGEKKIEMYPDTGKRRKDGMKVRGDFKPRFKSPGDLIQSDDWNDMQEEIKDDLLSLANAVEVLGAKSSTMIASGIASHRIFVELEWDVRPHILLSPSGTIAETESYVNMICYAHDISTRGFRVFCQSQDGKVNGIVNWVAIAVS